MHLPSSLKTNTWWKHISIEPAYALYWIADYQSTFYQQNLILQKACRINATHEPDLYTPCDDEKKGLAFVAFVNSWFHLISAIIVTLLCAVYIKWSDRAGRQRKFILILPTIGLNLMILSSFLHAFFWTLDPIYSVITYELMQFFTGGPILYYFAAMLYISDVSSAENRTARLGVLATMQYICLPVGNVCSGFILKQLGFTKSFLISFIISMGALVLGIRYIKDVSEPVEKKTPFWKSLNPINITSAIEVVFKKRRNNLRLILNIMLVAKILVLFSRAGEKSVLYIYMRHCFHWDERQYSFFDAFKNTGVIIGVLISMLLFSKYMKMHDVKIALFSSVWDTAAAISYLFASQSWQFYVIAILDMFHGAAFLAAKSYTTKIVETSELGNLTSVSALLSFISFLNKPTYNLLFKSYMDIFPNCFFLVSIAICILSCISFATCLVLLKENEKLDEAVFSKKQLDGEKTVKSIK
ncbi:lysosomal proton-coupled steroid conjugate and bile acid symporter SLC46A3-like [Planococcus citri]|uniref:lysosomal proton-coupled steroid conjugate and bile acid symporter SLC46A3-like n=1 Tax=Planococcus citri TaxID=170843 RepID=UPI0031F76CCE